MDDLRQRERERERERIHWNLMDEVVDHPV
jgi:hypothetical protein